jgi:hypothetical protein
MKSLRKFAYAAVLTLSAFAIQPTLAAAEDARGSFTLSHEVHWQKCVLAPGEYNFSIKTMGGSEFLTLRPLHGTGSPAMLLLTEVESPTREEENKLILVSRDGQSFVSAMSLPEFDMTLRFAVPPETASAPTTESASK